MTLDSEGSDGPVTLVDEFACSFVLGPHGKKRLLFGQGLQDARKAREGRRRAPKAPRVQEQLRQAYALRDRLAASPGLTQDALARELDITASYLGRILRLLDLPREFQDRILALPHMARRPPVSERRLRGMLTRGGQEQRKRILQQIGATQAV
ncbi:MAG: hypothetical protein HY922_06720 [Elusimicrobia bacterium]|nr:hypothetical protein [Elusimicrobiota bacterium]